MKKIFISLFLLSSFLNAEVLHNVSYLDVKNRCILNNYYSKDGSFYYQYAKDTSTVRSTISKDYSNSIIPGYQFNKDTFICSPEAWRVLGMSIEDFNFLNALIGLLFGFVFMVFTIYLFIKVGTKR